jgi:magnesium-protoporphyrin IX monomethyl ester (oxidative) cyclase
MAATMMKAKNQLGRAAAVQGRRARVASRVVRVQAAASTSTSDLDFKKMRDGVKVAADETILTPRFYTT